MTLEEAIKIVNCSDSHRAVPIEPTSAMRQAFHKARDEWENPPLLGVPGPDSPDHEWQAMLNAS